MKCSPYDLIVFDCDGTLTDTGSTHIRWCNDINLAFNYCLPIISLGNLDQMRKILGNPMQTVIRNYGFPEKDVDGLVKLYEKSFSLDPNYKSHSFPGVTNLLIKLRRKYLPTSIVSSNILTNIARDLGSDLENITEIITKENLEKNNWKKADALKWLQKYFRSKSPIYIGDTSKDKQAAEEANWPFIWAGYGWENPSKDCLLSAKDIFELEKLIGV